MNRHSLIKIPVGFACLLAAFNLTACGGDNAASETPTENGVADSSPPVVGLVGDEQIEVAFNAVFRDLGAVALDDVDGELSVLIAGDVDTRAPGDYQLVFSATDSGGNSGSVTRTVTVLDNPLPAAEVSTPIGPPANFFDGALVGADYWSETPEILSAGMGFSDILGLDAPELTFEVVRDAGGAWNQDYFCGDGTRNYTSAATQDQPAMAYIQQTPYGELKDGALGIDGLPIVFSWPVDTSTIGLTDFQFILNTGDIVRPLAVSAVGLTWETSSSPYDENNGPRLVGAKLNRITGPTVIIDEVGREYAVQGGTLRVVGLADLGQPEGGDVYYDECYDEDLDNYIDIILVGDEDAARSIRYLEVPSLEGGYSPMYNPFSDRFAAIAPVSGVLTTSLQQTCSPERFVPVLQTHGTADNQIPYDTASATVVSWVDFNQSGTVPEIVDLPDPFPANGTSVRRYTYSNSATGIDVEHLQIEGGQHVWPGSDGDSDIDMAQEVGNFVSCFDLNGPVEE